MLGKTSKPVIEILTGSLVSGYREVAGITPRGLKGFDFGGVGLGIVAALEKSGGGDRSDNKALFGRNLTRSNPIPVKNPWRHRRSLEEMERDSLEEYTIVTCHDPNKTCTTKVYSEAAAGGRKGDGRAPFRIQSCSRATVFDISPASCSEGCGGVPGPDFLSSCNLCHKKLHGKDIYMYRGEKAFCSSECRYRQMVVDERTEKCSSEASRGVVEVGVGVAGSPYKAQIFTKGILAV